MKRRGFTLIELMVVIAIIIILAAIAIPNYLNMTKRAKNSRVASDMASLATALETFKTDWGKYPIVATTAQKVNVAANNIYLELSGVGHAAAANTVFNGYSATNAIGETNPATGQCVEYMKAGTLTSMVNPFLATDSIWYGSSDGNKWILYADTTDAVNKYMFRTDGSSTPSYQLSTPSIP